MPAFQPLDHGRGGILNVSSIGAFQGSPGTANYAAAKSYVLSLGQAVHEELKGTGVAISTLCPGFTRTEFPERGGYDVSAMPGFLWQSAETVARVGLDGVAANKAVVIPGLHNRVLATTMRLLPMSVTRRLAGFVTDNLR